MRLGTTSQKILLFLAAGVALGFTRSSHKQKRILKALSREWKGINRHELYRSIQTLYQSRLIMYSENKDGSVSVVLKHNGRRTALRYKLEEMAISRPRVWDKKWRVVLFDIPEKKRLLRDTLRRQLRQLGFVELQKSAFVHPFECQKEIDFVIELYDACRFVRFIEANHIDNELYLMKKFGLLFTN